MDDEEYSCIVSTQRPAHGGIGVAGVPSRDGGYVRHPGVLDGLTVFPRIWSYQLILLVPLAWSTSQLATR